MRLYRVLALVLVLTFPVVALESCRPTPVTIVTPAGQRAYTADQLLAPVERLQDAAIAAYRTGELDRETSRHIVFVTVEIAEVTDAAETGWQTAVVKAWQDAKLAIPALTTGRLGVYVAAIDAVFFGEPHP